MERFPAFECNCEVDKVGSLCLVARSKRCREETEGTLVENSEGVGCARSRKEGEIDHDQITYSLGHRISSLSSKHVNISQLAFIEA